MDEILKDLRYAARMLLKNPGFTLVAVLALGLGIGANTAIFSVFNGMLWRPLAAPEPQQLVVLASKAKGSAFGPPLSYPDLLDFRQLKAVYADLAGYTASPVSFAVDGKPERAWSEMVSGSYFSVLGLRAAEGRLFAEDEGWVPGKDTIIVLDYKYWQRRFAGDRGVIGRKVEVNQHAFTIIGVAPEAYHGAYYFLEPDFYLPLSTIAVLDPTNATTLTDRNAGFLRTLGRLQPGVTAAQATAAMEPTMRRLSEEFPEGHRDVSIEAIPELKARPEPEIGGFMAVAMMVFMVLVGLVLLIACANVANLILARANGRRKELATRTAMGATRWRMIRQMLTESLLLAFCGGLAGLAFARWAALALMAIHIPTDIPLRLFDLQLDWRIFAYSFVIATLTGVIAGIFPAWKASRTDLAEVLKAGGRSGGSSAGHQRFRNALVVAQVAVSLLLLACAGFFIRSFQNSAHVDMGFRIDHTLMMSMDLGLQSYSEERGQRFFRVLQERVRNVPGVREAAIAANIPMGYDNSVVNVYGEGLATDEKSAAETVIADDVQSGYFEAQGVAIIGGRGFNQGDTAQSPKVAVINEEFAKKVWPGQSALGKTFHTEKNGPPIQVVGLTRTGKYLFLYEPPQPFVYFPLAQRYHASGTLVVRTEGDPQKLTSALREQIHEMDAGLPVYSITTMEAHVEFGKPLLPARLGAMVVGAFGVLGLILASVGVYGVVSYSVSQRTREIGIRTALGAQSGNVLGMVLKQGMGMALVGTTVGIALALLLFRGLRSMLYGVNSIDVATLGVVSALLLAVAFLASYVPALRATRVDPIVALREE